MNIDFKTSFGLGVVMSMRFINYAYCFLIGSYMKLGGVKNVYGKPMSGSEIYVVMMVIITAINIFGIISFYGQMVVKAAGATTVLFDVIDAPTNVEINPEKKGIVVNRETMRGEYRFEKVNFRYPTRPDLHILKDLDIVMEAGQTTAFVGPSGSGKSTIIQLVMRFYNPVDGKVTFDGEPIDSWDLRSLR